MMTVSDAGDARERGDLATLLDLLADTDQLTRCGAAQQLGKLGDPAAVPDLIRALGAADDGLRVSAIKSLAMIADPAALTPLVEVARSDAASGVRVTAADALATLGDLRGIDMLIALALDPEPEMIVTSDRNFRLAEGSRFFAHFMSGTEAEIAHTRRWALKRLRELHAADAVTRLNAAPRPRSLRTRFALSRTLRALRRT
jgi:hypothetical protein